MLGFLGVTGSLIAAAVGGYIAHMFVPLSKLKEWGLGLLAKVGIRL